MVSFKDFDSKLLKINKNSYRNIDIYYIGYIRMKSISNYESIHGANSLYFIVGKVDRYIEERNGDKCLNSASADKNKEVLKKYTKLKDGITID